jgi:hypothetical protein
MFRFWEQRTRLLTWRQNTPICVPFGFCFLMAATGHIGGYARELPKHLDHAL